ncbi:MAG TPA: hypothetical protein VJV75_03720 [Candidatus Polarisedimenticolia bacterium]|nr:hypothetical protein [Candidatus Polarisedimenticolia bacterium]
MRRIEPFKRRGIRSRAQLATWRAGHTVAEQLDLLFDVLAEPIPWPDETATPAKGPWMTAWERTADPVKPTK